MRQPGSGLNLRPSGTFVRRTCNRQCRKSWAFCSHLSDWAPTRCAFSGRYGGASRKANTRCKTLAQGTGGSLPAEYACRRPRLPCAASRGRVFIGRTRACPPHSAWMRRYLIATRNFAKLPNLQPPHLPLEGEVLSRDHKPRVLLVVAHFDDTRNPNGRPNFIPQGLAHAFLAGAFHRRNVEVRLYSEFHSGPLKDERAFAWPDMLVLTGVTSAFDRMRQLAAYVRIKSPRLRGRYRRPRSSQSANFECSGFRLCLSWRH